MGELVGALSEERTGLIRYLDIAIRDADKHVLVPIGHARIERESAPPHVCLRAATHEDLLSVPAFVEDQTALDAGYQQEVMEVYGRLFYGSRYYAHPAYDHSTLYAGESPVDTSEAPEAEPRLRPLSELSDFRLARGAPALVGWDVVDEAGDAVGVITELLVETRARRVRYAVLELESPKRPAVLPIGYIRRAGDGERVSVPALTVEDVRLLPPYEPPLTRAEENRLHAAIEGRLSGERYFDRPDFRSNADTIPS